MRRPDGLASHTDAEGSHHDGAIAHRSKDLKHIRGIVVSQPRLDMKYIRKHVQEFEVGFAMPQLWEDISQLLKKPVVRKRQR